MILRHNQSQDDDDNNMVFIGAGGPCAAAGGAPDEDSEGTDNGGDESDNDKNGQVPGDPVDRQCRSRGPWDGNGLNVSQEPIGPVAPVIMNLHVKCPIFSLKDDEYDESHLCAVMTG